MRSRITPVLARAITGTDLAAGATGVYVPFDGIPGAPLRNSQGDFAHVVGLRLNADILLDTTNTITTAPPGALARAVALNMHLRAGGLEVIEPGVDGEEISLLMDAVHGFRLAPDSLEIPDATTGNVAVAEVNIDLRFDDLSSFFGRENDSGIPLAAFSTARDKENGLRFDWLATSALLKSLTGVQLDTAGAGITRAEVYALIRYSKHLNLKTPTRYRFYNEARADFSIDLKGGGQCRALIVADPPAVGTGLRDHVAYQNISLDFAGEVVYSGRTAQQITRMANLARMSPAQRLIDFDSTPATAVVSGPVGAAAALQRSGGVLDPLHPEVLPLFLAPPGVSKQDLPEGRINVSIGTRTTTAERVGYAWLPDPDGTYADNVWAGAGMTGSPTAVAHGADKSNAGSSGRAKRLPIAGK